MNSNNNDKKQQNKKNDQNKTKNNIKDKKTTKMQNDIKDKKNLENKKMLQNNSHKKTSSIDTDPMFQDLYQTMIDKKLKAKARREELRKQKKKKVAMVGFVILIFALFGVYNIGSILAVEVGNIVTGKNRLKKYDDFIKPVVLLDVVPFESVDKLDEKIKLQVGIWSIVMSGKTENYKKDEMGMIYMPAVDIEAEVTRIFGPGQKFTHESFGDYSSQFYFDKASNSLSLIHI